MSDLIDRQQAIDALDCINGTEEVLRSLPSAQPEPQWIPVSERLPEKKGESFFDGMVLTTLRDTETGELYVLNDNYCGDGNWLMCLPDDPTEVIAWMPLPEPYKPNNE